MKMIKTIVGHLFPFHGGSAEACLDEINADSANHATFEKLKAKTFNASPETSKEMRDHALRQADKESKRQESIRNRAQGLLIAQAVFGVIFTIISAASSSLDKFSIYILTPIVASIAYLISQLILMSLLLNKVLGPAGYKRIGSSELATWASNGGRSFVRLNAIAIIENYREAVVVNDFKINCLYAAQCCLRNITVAMAIAAVCLLAGALSPKKHTPLIIGGFPPILEAPSPAMPMPVTNVVVLCQERQPAPPAIVRRPVSKRRSPTPCGGAPSKEISTPGEGVRVGQ